FQAEDGIRDRNVTGVQTCALPISVLSDTAIRAEDLDEEKALAARQQAEEALSKTKDKADIAVVEAELAMLAAQALAARKFRKARSEERRVGKETRARWGTE